MAYTDILQSSRQSLGSSLDRKARKREGSLDRLHETLSRLGSQKFTTEERESSDEAASARLMAEINARRSDTAATIQAAEDLEKLRQEGRAAEIDLLTDQQLAVLEARYGFESDMATDAYILRLSEMDQAQLDALERVDAQRRAEEKLIDYDRTKYANGFYVDVDEHRYQWSTPEQYEAAMNEMLEKARQRAIELEARLRDDPASETWGDAADRVKELLLLPSVYNEETGTWKGANPNTPEEWEAAFRNRMAGQGTFSEKDMDAATEYFMLFIESIAPEEPVDPEEVDTTAARDLLFGVTEESPFGRLLTNPEALPENRASQQFGFMIPDEYQTQPDDGAAGMGTAGYGPQATPEAGVPIPEPKGWDSTEMAMWGQFQRLFNSVPQEKLPAVYEAMDIVANQDVDPVHIQDLIDALLAPSGPRPFNYTPREELN